MALHHAGTKRSYRVMREQSASLNSSRGISHIGEQDPQVSPADRKKVRSEALDQTVQPRCVSFVRNASIVLVGIRGVGKSSLGVIAATAYDRRLIELEKAFQDATGFTTHAFRKLQGPSDYRRKHQDVLRSTLKTHAKDCVIICSFSDLEHEGAELLRDFAKTNPVIHVTRDAQGIQSYLQVWSEERVRKLLRATGPILRSCSSYEFFNLSEPSMDQAGETKITKASDVKSPGLLFLTLKRVEKAFLQLLQTIFGNERLSSSHHSAYPLSRVRVEDRQFTICTSVRVDEVLARNIDLDEVQIGADAVELELPTSLEESGSGALELEELILEAAEAYAIARRASILPIIVTARGNVDSGSDRVHNELLADYCFRLAPDYCTLNMAMSDSSLRTMISNRGHTTVIGSTDLQKRPANGWEDDVCVAQCRKADELGLEMLSITMPDPSMEDNLALEAFRERVVRSGHVRLIAYNRGPQGKTSKCFNRIMTPVSRATPNLASGLTATDPNLTITSKQVFNALFATFMYEPMHFFIYGAIVDYSLSPAMHNAAYEACGMPHRYFTHSCPTLDDLQRLAQDHHFGGAAVVQPYKTEVLQLMDGLSPEARAIGAVNTVVPVRELDTSGAIPPEPVLLSQRNRSGPVKALYGQNTDWIGVRACLRRGLSPANTIRAQSTGLICGAGGQARSTIYAMLSLGLKTIFICNRTLEHAIALADHYNELIRSKSISGLESHNASGTSVKVIDSFKSEWPRSEYRYPSLVVSTIPPQAVDGTLSNFTIPEPWLSSPTGGVAIELAYRPLHTPIVRQMRSHAHKGWIFMDGFDVLPEQAFAQFELFTGRRAPREVMRKEVISRYNEEHGQVEPESG